MALFERLETFGEHAERTVGDADAGPWEFRGLEQPHTFSAAMCWAGCDRLAHIAASLGLDDRAADWGRRAARIRETSSKARGIRGSMRSRPASAATIWMRRGAAAGARHRRPGRSALPRDARRDRTRAAHGDWLFRYRHPDDFGTPATAFTICAFWYVNALAAAGRREEARELFQRLLAGRTSLGLLSEDIDPATGELWGNFPQTYSMVGIINCAVRLSRRWEDVL